MIPLVLFAGHPDLPVSILCGMYHVVPEKRDVSNFLLFAL